MGLYYKVSLYRELYHKAGLYKGCTYLPPMGEDLPLQGDFYYPLSCSQEVIETLNLFSDFPMGDQAFSSNFGS